MDDNADEELESDDLEELPEELDEEDEGDLVGFDDDLPDDIVEDLDEVALDDEVLEADDDDVEVVAPRPTAHDDDDEEEDDDELDPDDVEASLDVILKDRLVIEDAAEQDDEDGTPEPDERGEVATAVVPKRPDEFVCQSCFLVKHPSQLADSARQLCRDCV